MTYVDCGWTTRPADVPAASVRVLDDREERVWQVTDFVTSLYVPALAALLDVFPRIQEVH
jgi:hypothetical protein